MPTTKNTPTEPDPEPTPPEPTPSHDEVMERLVEERGVPTGGPTETEIPEHGVAIGHQDPEAEDDDA